SAWLITTRTSSASDAAQAEELGLITWRSDSVNASLSAEELRTNLVEMNNALLASDPTDAAAHQALVEKEIAHIESELSLISVIPLPGDDQTVVAKDAQAFHSL